MITERQALQLLRSYIHGEKRIEHSTGVAEFAFAIERELMELL